MYNSTQRLVPNPINRYWIGADTPGIMYNKDGSLDVYIQPQSPGQAKQNNWLPSPTTNQPFNMVLRLYWPDQPQALNGTWSAANTARQCNGIANQKYGSTVGNSVDTEIPYPRFILSC